MDAIHSQFAQIRAKLEDVQFLNELEAKTNVPKEYISVGGASIFLLIVLFGIGVGSLCNIIGFIYPAYKSLKAIENRASNEATQWLIYWVVYSFFSIIEVFTDFLLYWIPYYYAAKLSFLLWCMLPQTKGAKYLYENFLKDFLKQNESKIDEALKGAKSTADKVAAEAKKATDDVAAKVSENVKKSDDDKKEE
mmetsp:Transcript_8759/g.17354  ORF Transcript_8759/g.17354 Transcript_8759/m.17354 type:complete len:193 (-) Transcript_8759:320-898(-)